MQQIPQEGGKQAGRWTKEEHQRFMYAIMQYGKDWKKVEQYVKTRSGSQVRSHAQKFFSKLQKTNNTQPSRQGSNGLQMNLRHQQFSQTQFDIEREINNEMTPSTPMQLVSFIRKQPKQEGKFIISLGGKINLSNLQKNLLQHQQFGKKAHIANEKWQSESGTAYKNMGNLLSVLQDISDKQDIKQQQSFFIALAKKYKRLFKQVGDFDKLIELKQPSEHISDFNNNRKKSFTLLEANDLGQAQRQEKMEEIKRKINTDGSLKQKPHEINRRKISQDSIQLTIPPMNRLSTIQQQPREQEQVSYKAIISQEILEELKKQSK